MDLVRAVARTLVLLCLAFFCLCKALFGELPLAFVAVAGSLVPRKPQPRQGEPGHGHTLPLLLQACSSLLPFLLSLLSVLSVLSLLSLPCFPAFTPCRAFLQAEALAMAHDVTSALAYLHSLDLCHGDLRAENVMLQVRLEPETAASRDKPLSPTRRLSA